MAKANQSPHAYSFHISSFCFLSNFQTPVIIFSGIKRPTKLKLGAHMVRGLMYDVY